VAIPIIEPGQDNYDVYAGSAWLWPLLWEHNDAPVDLTGCTARMYGRINYPDLTTVFEINETTGITLGGTSGEITLLLSDTVTTAMGVAVGHVKTVILYDLEIEDATNVVQILRGVITLWPEATRQP
jgi:hypothetical protein